MSSILENYKINLRGAVRGAIRSGGLCGYGFIFLYAFKKYKPKIILSGEIAKRLILPNIVMLELNHK
jgi:hypothetical protein